MAGIVCFGASDLAAAKFLLPFICSPVSSFVSYSFFFSHVLAYIVENCKEGVVNSILGVKY